MKLDALLVRRLRRFYVGDPLATFIFKGVSRVPINSRISLPSGCLGFFLRLVFSDYPLDFLPGQGNSVLSVRRLCLFPGEPIPSRGVFHFIIVCNSYEQG